MKYEEQVILKSNFTLSTSDLDVLSLLYTPLMGPKALTVYLGFTSMLSRAERISEEHTIAYFCDLYNFIPNDLNNAIKKLEGIGLVKRFLQGNTYVFILCPPLTATQFLRDNVLGIYIYGTIGDNAYQSLKKHFQIPKLIEKNYKENTLTFDQVYTDKVLDDHKEKLAELFGKPTAQSVDIKHLEFDYLQFEKQIIEDFIPKNKTEFKRCILNTAFVYAFDEYEMASVVKDSIDQIGYYNPSLIQKKAIAKYLFIHEAAPKLKNKYGGFNDYKELETITTVNLLNEIIQDDSRTSYFADYLTQLAPLYLKLGKRFTRGVINCMIIHALQINDNSLPKNTYFLKMADTWEHELNIRKLEDAVNFILTHKTEQKKKTYQPSKGKKNVKPTEEWVDNLIGNIEEGFIKL